MKPSVDAGSVFSPSRRWRRDDRRRSTSHLRSSLVDMRISHSVRADCSHNVGKEAMTSTKLRDALAERLRVIMNDYVTDPATRQSHLDTLEKYVASRLLESVPGEEEMAQQIHEHLFPNSQGEWGPVSMRFARFLREHVGVWINLKGA